jgi:hypothetical protein
MKDDLFLNRKKCERPKLPLLLLFYCSMGSSQPPSRDTVPFNIALNSCSSIELKCVEYNFARSGNVC